MIARLDEWLLKSLILSYRVKHYFSRKVHPNFRMKASDLAYSMMQQIFSDSFYLTLLSEALALSAINFFIRINLGELQITNCILLAK